MLRGAAVGGVGLAAAGLIGCGEGKKADEGTAPAGAAKGTAAAGTPKTGGTLKYASGDVTHFDIHRLTGGGNATGVTPGYNQLVHFDPMVAVEGPNTIIPDLAQKWEILDNGMTYVFHLAPGVKFHDGTPFTSADVAASIDRQRNPGTLVMPRGVQLATIDASETPDDLTYRIKMKRPVSPQSLLPTLGQGWMPIFAKKDIAIKDGNNKKVNGTGPFRQALYEAGNRNEFVKNKEYFVKGQPYLDGITIFNVPDLSTEIASVQSGALDLIDSLDPTTRDLEALKRALGDKAQYLSTVSLGTFVLDVNRSRKPWDDIRVRQALAKGINKADVLSVILGGDGAIGGHMMPGGFWGLSTADVQKIEGYQPYGDASLAEGKKLLSAAGVPDGFAFPLATQDGKQDQDLAVLVADHIRKLGMQPKLDIMTSAAATKRLDSADFDLQPKSYQSTIDDPDAVYAELHLSKSQRNYGRVGSPVVDDLYQKQSVESNIEKRRQLVNDMQKASLADLGKIILTWRNRQAGVRSDVKNFSLHTGFHSSRRREVIWLDR